MLTEQAVIAAYQLLLGRPPESDVIVQNYVAHASFETLRESILGSEEFADRVVAQPGVLTLAACVLGNSSRIRLASRQLEHLASLDLPLWGRSVLCASIGAGLLPSFFVDRYCRVVVADTEAASDGKSALEHLRRDGLTGTLEVRRVDLDDAPDAERAPAWQIVASYDTRLVPCSILRFLRNLGRSCSDLLVLDTRVSFGTGDHLNVCKDNTAGDFAIPTRRWLWQRLAQDFAHVYVPRTQPCHEDYALTWSVGEQRKALARAVFVASRSPLDETKLSPVLLDEQAMGA